MQRVPDHDLIDLIQAEIPLVPRPYAEFARALGLDEVECIRRLRDLEARGVFRRIGASVDVRAFGGTGILCAAEIDENDVPEAADIINAHAEVTHNYQRAHERFPLWFTIISLRPERIPEILSGIRKSACIRTVLELPATHVFKTRVFFPTGPQRAAGGPAPRGRRRASVAPPTPPDDRDLALLRIIQDDFPIAPRPFALIAERAGLKDEGEVLQRLHRWRQTGALRRICAFIRRRRLGYRADAMLVWDMPEPRARRIGENLARLESVSHCYLRRPHPSFPYRLYAMVHGRTGQDLRETLDLVIAAAEGSTPLTLRTVKEWKRSSPRLVS